MIEEKLSENVTCYEGDDFNSDIYVIRKPNGECQRLDLSHVEPKEIAQIKDHLGYRQYQKWLADNKEEAELWPNDGESGFSVIT